MKKSVINYETGQTFIVQSDNVNEFAAIIGEHIAGQLKQLPKDKPAATYHVLAINLPEKSITITKVR